MKPTVVIVLSVLVLAPATASAGEDGARRDAADARQPPAWQRELIARNDRMARIAGVGVGPLRMTTRRGSVRRHRGPVRSGAVWTFGSPRVEPLTRPGDFFRWRLRRGDVTSYGYPYGYRTYPDRYGHHRYGHHRYGHR